MRSVTFQVPGKPQGKARARTYYNPAAKKHVSHTPDNTVLYENLIKDQFLNHADGFYMGERDAGHAADRGKVPASEECIEEEKEADAGGRDPSAEEAGHG